MRPTAPHSVKLPRNSESRLKPCAICMKEDEIANEPCNCYSCSTYLYCHLYIAIRVKRSIIMKIGVMRAKWSKSGRTMSMMRSEVSAPNGRLHFRQPTGPLVQDFASMSTNISYSYWDDFSCLVIWVMTSARNDPFNGYSYSENSLKSESHKTHCKCTFRFSSVVRLL